ncbi:MAG: NUDIX domain-containing protein [Clostridia bacterium]|nr:NUDIX domain-containing protein [Bacilli bacterium]MBR3324775.1 NUDIX domain-containing protein [Clostridia bacterium]
MSYVSDLRKMVGNFPLQLPGTGVVLWRKNNFGEVEILLQLRQDNNKFGLLGGGIELNETYEQCAIREIQEESGIEFSVQDLELKGVYAGPNHVTVLPNGDVIHHTVVVYTIYYYGTMVFGHSFSETTDLSWFTIGKLREMLQETPEVFFKNNVPIIWDVAYKYFE